MARSAAGRKRGRGAHRHPRTWSLDARPEGRYKVRVNDAGPDQGQNDPVAPPSLLLAGRFTLVQELGSGSSGTVYRARLTAPYADLDKGAEVAIKFLRQDRMLDEKAKARFVAEGQLGQSVRHANVAAIFGVETFSVLGLESTCLVMELVRGTTLRKFLQQQGPPVEDLTRRIGRDAALGLQSLHRRGVVHRDVKPENLVLTEQGEVKIVDLGLARPFGAAGSGRGSAGSSGSSSGGVRGTSSGSRGIGGSVAYTSPEALQGRAVGPQSDLYALGVVLFEVATGKHPFAHCLSADEVIHAHLHEAPPRPSHWRPRISPLLEQLLLELLHKDPAARPKDAASVARILQQGEVSDWWQEHEQRAPALASGRRLQRMRRPAETPFFGLRDELAQLQRQLAAARSGKGRARCITGPQGIGRRRLLDEAMTQWLQKEQSLVYLGGEADPGLGHAEPFASSLLDWLLRGDGADSPQATARAEARAREEFDLDDADAAALVAVAAGHSQEEPEVRANRLANALLSLPKKGRTLVVRVDAADRLDTSGKLVLQRLSRDLTRRHLLLLATAGPDWQPPVGMERMELHGLEEPAFLLLGRALFAPGRSPDAQLAAAHATFSGSPGNLIEALEHLVQNDALFGRPGDYHGLSEDAELRPAPHHLQRFEQRVQRMPQQHRRTLAAAAVLGQRCALTDLVALTEIQELSVLETLSLFRGRVIRAQGGEVAFRHRDFQQALLRQIAPEERQALHRRAAEVFEQRNKPALEIGMHRSQALDHDGCIEPLLTGLQEIVRAGSRRTSLRIAARLQVHVQQLPEGERRQRTQLRLLLLSARARRNAFQAQAAADQFQKADVTARELGDRLSSGEALTGLAGATFDLGRLMQAILLLENAHKELEDPQEPRARVLAADAHALHGRIMLYLGESEDGLRHVQAALRLLPEGELERQRHLQIDLARLEALRHHYPTALKTLSKVDDRATRHLPRVHMRMRLYRGQFRAALGDEDAAQDLRACIQEAERLSLWAYAARARIFLGERAFFDGRDDEARAELRAGRDYAMRASDPLGEALAGIHLFRLGEDGTGLEEAVERLGLPSLQTAFWIASGARAEAHGDTALRAQCAERALDLCKSADVPLALHLRALAMNGLDASARALVRTIAEKFRDGRTQRRFLRAWEKGARV